MRGVKLSLLYLGRISYKHVIKIAQFFARYLLVFAQDV
ncbi:hypothetical protein ALQ61_200048 [Pseudomonas coronafaciens pv. zizaniae]|nr:hypothetical protein ALQ61_200048 [Pseudomonas coronafaciens pv. zizaniae]RMV69281.1 hypothetical protein ALP06_200304 [Pseudomonas coronafaciens pv. atropurpurea]